MESIQQAQFSELRVASNFWSFLIKNACKVNFAGEDEASRTFRFKLEKSLPRNFQPSLICARQILRDQGILLTYPWSFIYL